GGTRVMGPLNGVLWDFMQLSRAADVQGFVKRYGPLYLCDEHGLPVLHRHPDKLCLPRYRKKGRDLFLEEPVARYLELSQRASALVKIADKARLGTPLTVAEIRA